jgi:4-alpha-glucanotransferase
VCVTDSVTPWPELVDLAGRYGVATSYRDTRGQDVPVSAATLVAVLRAFDVSADDPAACRAALADPRTPAAHAFGAAATGAAREPIPAHPAIADRRIWGLTLQLPAVRSPASWGFGDLGDLAELGRRVAAEAGAGFVVVNPLHAGSPHLPAEPSPYLPVSRRYVDPIYLRVADVPGYRQLPAEQLAHLEALANAARARTRDEPLLDRDACWRDKRAALWLLYQHADLTDADYQRFQRQEGEPLRRHAIWCALAETYGNSWHDWPTEMRAATSPDVAEFADRQPRLVGFHSWLQWLLDVQLTAARDAARAAGMSLGLIHDLAVGSSASGAETWAAPELFAAGITTGAPPDDFNEQGQTWGSRPWRPDALAAADYAPYRAMLRAVLRHADGLRIDHVMGLFRLWWVPDGQPASAGTYVYYDHTAMLRVLAEEARAAGALVVGEDLGTVEPWVRGELAAWGVYGTSVLWFESEQDQNAPNAGGPLPPELWRTACLATLTTHDLPPTASYLTGEYLDERARLGLLTRPLGQERVEQRALVDAWLELASERGLFDATGARHGHASGVDGDDTEAGVAARVVALHRLLARAPSRLLGVWLPDVVGDRRAVNLPGTTEASYPNWRVPITDHNGRLVLLDDLVAAAGKLAAVVPLPPVG